MDLELRHLRVICAIDEAGSITKAAAGLGMSQPTLTTQLRRIERLLGSPLFVRSRKGTRPTTLGEFVLVRARALLPSVDAIRRDSATYLEFTSGCRPLRYAAMAGPLMVGLLQELQGLYPGADVVLHTETHVGAVLDLVTSGQQDLATIVEYVRGEPGPPADVDRLTIATEPVFALLPTAHPLAGAPSVALAQLHDAHWAVPTSQGDGLMESLTQVCERAGFTAIVRHRAEATAVRELIAAGQAVSLGQATFRVTEGIVPRPLEGSPLKTRHVLVWRRDNAVAAHIPAIAERAERAYAEAVRRSPHYLAWLTDHGPLD
jgi:DNA-binding transcriptional LysR family regulator